MTGSRVPVHPFPSPRSHPVPARGPPRAKGGSRDRLAALSPCSRSLVPGRSLRARLRVPVSVLALARCAAEAQGATRCHLQPCCYSAPVLVSPSQESGVSWRLARERRGREMDAAEAGKAGTQQQQQPGAASTSGAGAAVPFGRSASRLGAPGAESFDGALRVRRARLVSSARSCNVLVVKLTGSASLGIAGAKGSAGTATRGRGLLREGVPQDRQEETVSPPQSLSPWPLIVSLCVFVFL